MTTYDDLWLERFVDLETEFMQEVVRYNKNSSFDPVLYKKEKMAAYKKNHMSGNETVITIFGKEQNGVLSAFTSVSIGHDYMKICYQDMTGVLPSYRGRMLGIRLKTTMLKYIRDNFPQVETIMTANDFDNAHIQKINTELGFVKNYEVYGYMFDLNQLDNLK